MILEPFIAEKFSGSIWKIIIDEASHLLCVEVRDAENRQVSFAAIDLDKGKVNFKDVVLPEKWLTGISGTFKGIIFIHGYQSAQSPAHKGITAISGVNGSVLWTNYNDAIRHISVNGPVTNNTQVQPPKLFLTDTQTGQQLRSFDEMVDLPIQQDIRVPDITGDIPADFTNPFSGQLSGVVQHLAHNSFRIVSLHLLNEGSLKQVLMISKGGELVYTDLLNDNIQKLQPEAFILYLNQLIYIKNKTELKVLNL